MSKEKAKKPIYKKWWFWVIVLAVLWGIGNSASDDKEQTEKKTEKASTEVKEEKKTDESKKKEEKPKVEKPKKKEDNRTIAEKLQEDNDNIDKASLKDGVLTLSGEGKTTFSENTLFMSVYDFFEAMHDGFQDKDVKEVYVELTTTMVDQKGNESVEPVIKYNYSRESFEELNYEKFKEMAYSEEWRILTEANYYYIHPGIYKNLKDKYKDHVRVEGFN